MKFHLILIASLALFSCSENTESLHKNIPEAKRLEVTALDTFPKQHLFLIDHCEYPYNVVLERDSNKGKDSCILRIKSKQKKITRVEVLNMPIDKSRIESCEKDYVSVSFACGGPCHSHIFVFTDTTRPNEQYGYVQYIPDHPNIITYFEKEAFEKLIIRNLMNGKEMNVEISDCDRMEYGRVDTMFIKNSNLHLKYNGKDSTLQSKVVSLKRLLK